jgi:hypothetical protein
MEYEKKRKSENRRVILKTTKGDKAGKGKEGSWGVN